MASDPQAKNPKQPVLEGQELVDHLKEQALSMALSGQAQGVEAFLAGHERPWLIFSVVHGLGRELRSAGRRGEKDRHAQASQALTQCAGALGRAAKTQPLGHRWLEDLISIDFSQEAFDELLLAAGEKLLIKTYKSKARDEDAWERAPAWGPAFKILPGFAEIFVQEAQKAWRHRDAHDCAPRWTMGVVKLGDPDILARCWREGQRLGLDMGKLSQEVAPRFGTFEGISPLGLALLALNEACSREIASFCPPQALMEQARLALLTRGDANSVQGKKRRDEVLALAESIELAAHAKAGPAGPAPRL